MQDLQGLLHRTRSSALCTFSQALLELGLLDSGDLATLVSPLKFPGHGDEHALVSSGTISEVDYQRARAYMVRTPEIDAMAFLIQPAALACFPWTLAQHFHVLPLGMIESVLYLGSATPLDRDLQNQVSVASGHITALVWADKADLTNRLAHPSAPSPPPAGLRSALREIGLADPTVAETDMQLLLTKALNELHASSGPQHVNQANDSSSVIQLVNKMIADAYAAGASDIHIETNPGDQISRIRFRKDGDLENYLSLPFALRAALVSRIKIMSKLDISEHRRPQDGKINFNDYASIQLELRVAILPTHDNFEDVVMRLLATSDPIPLRKLGFSRRDEAIIQSLCDRQFGLILACGPTGSGKTTTLHSLLAHINTDIRKIWTAEDPIEITQKGLRQLQVNPRIGVTFASAMRAFLRADPDVIMIGEVRDAETASVCVEASLTGHLVMSTLHTNSAAESVIRLLDLGMDPLNFGDSLIAIVAQRLVRALCPACSMSHVLTEVELDALALDYVHGTALPAATARLRLLDAGSADVGLPTLAVSLREARGCSRCGGRGYKGRLGVYEVLENIGGMAHLIQARAPTSEVFALACANGMRTLRQDALEKACAGLIDLKQVRTV